MHSSAAALYDADGNMISDSLLRRRQGIVGIPAPVPAEISSDTIEEPVIYGGMLINQFGHFIIESLSRLWLADKISSPEIVFAAHDDFKAHHNEILELLGIRSRIRLVDRPARLRRVALPEPGYRIPDFLHDTHRDFLARKGPVAVPSRGDRVYISRSRLAKDRRKCVNEVELEEALVKLGWRIFHPQEHSVGVQLEVLGAAFLVMGREGSFFFNSLLFQYPSFRTLLIRDQLSANFDMVARAKGLKQFDLIGAHDPNGQNIHLNERRFHDVEAIVAYAERFEALPESQLAHLYDEGVSPYLRTYYILPPKSEKPVAVGGRVKVKQRVTSLMRSLTHQLGYK